MLSKIGQILLIPVLIASSIGMTIDIHYCQHKLYDIAIFEEAQNCCTSNMNADHEKAHHCKNTSDHQNSCKHETLHLNKVDNFVISIFNFENIWQDIFSTPHFLSTDYNLHRLSQQFKFLEWDCKSFRIQSLHALLQVYLL
jgi:hypothetical protein